MSHGGRAQGLALAPVAETLPGHRDYLVREYHARIIGLQEDRSATPLAELAARPVLNDARREKVE